MSTSKIKRVKMYVAVPEEMLSDKLFKTFLKVVEPQFHWYPEDAKDEMPYKHEIITCTITYSLPPKKKKS